MIVVSIHENPPTAERRYGVIAREDEIPIWASGYASHEAAIAGAERFTRDCGGTVRDTTAPTPKRGRRAR